MSSVPIIAKKYKVIDIEISIFRYKKEDGNSLYTTKVSVAQNELQAPLVAG